MQPDISAQTLSELLRYDAHTGKLYWKPRQLSFFRDERASKSWHSQNCGREALTAKIQNGYRNGSILGRCGFRAHRVAWAIFYGEWPSCDVDHINGDPSDNRICNLRLASKPENAQNQAPQSRAKSSRYKGVHWRTERSKWVAMITVNGRKMRVGSFFDEASAAQAYNAAARRFYGPFARLNDV